MTKPDAMVECHHCMHDTGVILTSNPPQAVEICCMCGEKKTLRLVIPLDSPKGHGKYHPSRTLPESQHD
jgi:hypothetical protein